jgi:hypothetical protein
VKEVAGSPLKLFSGGGKPALHGLTQGDRAKRETR